MCMYAKQMRNFKECKNPTSHVLTTRVVTQPWETNKGLQCENLELDTQCQLTYPSSAKAWH